MTAAPGGIIVVRLAGDVHRPYLEFRTLGEFRRRDRTFEGRYLGAGDREGGGHIPDGDLPGRKRRLDGEAVVVAGRQDEIELPERILFQSDGFVEVHLHLLVRGGGTAHLQDRFSPVGITLATHAAAEGQLQGCHLDGPAEPEPHHAAEVFHGETAVETVLGGGKHRTGAGGERPFHIAHLGGHLESKPAVAVVRGRRGIGGEIMRRSRRRLLADERARPGSGPVQETEHLPGSLTLTEHRHPVPRCPHHGGAVQRSPGCPLATDRNFNHIRRFRLLPVTGGHQGGRSGHQE